MFRGEGLECVFRKAYSGLENPKPRTPKRRMWTGSGDSQLVNSVYFDNRQMQLYHGRMDKTPGAIALRLRW